jgi:hypothetical protein
MLDPMPENPGAPAPFLACGPAAALFYVQNGLRVVPLRPDTKTAARRGFGLGNPAFCTPPLDFKPDELVAILMGPCPLGSFAGGRLLCGFDLDAPFTRDDLERRLGPLPPTLSSKKGRHLYYWITARQNELAIDATGDALAQGNDIFRTKAAGQGACDLRCGAGGYFLERGEWDAPGGFDRRLIADLPQPAFEALLAARKTRRGRPGAVCPVSIERFENPAEPTPFAQLGEARIDIIARELAAYWPKPGQGGGHDLALALGGVLADAWGSLDDIANFAARVFHYASAPNAIAEVLASVDARRRGGRNAYGWPTLKRMLCDANMHRDPRRISNLLSYLRNGIPGLAPAKLASKTTEPS